MPYPNEHAARIKNPDLYEEFARVNDDFGTGIHAIYGIRIRDGKRVSELQAIRFDKKKFTVAQAKKWLSDHDYKPLEFVPANGEEKASQFSGETPWDAIVHHMSLNIEEEKAFLEFCTTRNVNTESELSDLVYVYEQWSGKKEENMSETNEEKMYAGEMPEVMVTRPPLGGATSFAELDAVMEAEEMAMKVGDMSHQFYKMVGNIMDNPAIEDKAAAVAALADEFSERMGQATKETETHDKELLRYKEIESDDNLATEDDFVGGCQICGFGEPEIMKELTTCPFCRNEPGDETDV